MKALRTQWKWYNRHGADIALLASLVGLASTILLFVLY